VGNGGENRFKMMNGCCSNSGMVVFFESFLQILENASNEVFENEFFFLS
jgi:hypothetical protein